MFNNLHLKIPPALALRIGLGGVFLYASVYSILNPANWVGFVPPFIENIMPKTLFLTIHGALEIGLSIALLIGIARSLTALIAFLDIAAILLFYGIDEVTFRDFGLLMAALSLFLLSQKRESLNPESETKT